MKNIFPFIDGVADRLSNFVERTYKKNSSVSHIIVYIMIGVGLFFVFNAIILGDENNQLWLIIYNFQTLITGIFAIIAALITVRTMRKTDETQEDRHRELISMNLRHDRMIVRRAVNPQLGLIAWYMRQLRSRIEYFKQDNEFQRIGIISADFAKNITNECTMVLEFLARPQIVEVEPLLSPDGLSAIQDLVGFLNQVIKDLGGVAELDRKLIEPFNPLANRMEGKCINAIELLNSSIYMLSILELSLKELATEFGI